MLVSLNWLTDYVDISMPAAELGDLLTRIGLNLEGITETDTDIVLDLEVTSNRPDCLGHLGVAREIAAVTGVEFKPPVIGQLPTSGKVKEMTAVDVEASELCPRYTARVIRNVKIGPSPQWMIERLEAVGLRSVNNVVDATNYVLMEYSQPLHAFDYDKLAGGRIIVRRAREGEVLVSIDGTTCRLDEKMLVIADADKSVAIAGIMGGLDSEVADQTTNVLIEAAQFDPLNTRRTSRKLQILSDSNYRFERGVDPVRLDEASLRACQLILDIAGGTLADGVVDVWNKPWRPSTVTLRPTRCDALLGIRTPPDRQVEILNRLDLEARLDGESIVATVPSHRSDISREVDLIEEIARIEGYDRIPTSAIVTHSVCGENLAGRTRRAVGEMMAAAGFDETVTSSFIDADEADLFGWRRTVCVDATTRQTNNALRPTLLPSLLRVCKTNRDAGNADLSLFELASVFPPAGDGGLPAEHMELGMVSTNDLRDLRGALEAVVKCIKPTAAVDIIQADVAGLTQGASGDILIDGKPAGAMGIVDPVALDRYGLGIDKPIAAARVRFDVLLEIAGATRSHLPLGKFPAIKRDLSLIMDETVTWRELTETIASVDQATRRAVEYVTTYRGKQIPAGRKSVTMELTYRSDEGTLRGEQVDEHISELVSTLKTRFSAELRV